MDIKLFDYNLPLELIAQQPLKSRDHSKLLVFDKKSKELIHDKFFNLPKYLKPDDVLVFNNTKVFSARLFGHKETGGKIEVFLLKNIDTYKWQVLIGGKVKNVGLKIIFNKILSSEVVEKISEGVWQIRFNKSKTEVLKITEDIGHTPTPPYVKKQAKLKDYQTVYADKVGSVAAPTAGFHFTKQLINKIHQQKIQMEYVTLHVGYGTFQPIKVNDVTKHKIHEEMAEINMTTMKRLYQAKKEGKRIIAVGTTTVRVLESVFNKKQPSKLNGYKGWLDIFIYPGYKYKFVDAMITNFHLPKSSLLLLVAAFIGRKNAISIYKQAVKLKYRFYSFGDGMFLK